MRNGINTALVAHTGHADWYDRIAMLPREAYRVQNAKDTIRRANKPVVPGRVVAGVTFEFWTSLLSAGAGPQGYGTALWSPNNAALIQQAFPFLTPPNQNRSFVHRRFNTIRLLRNRVSHHEPIWRGLRLQSRQLIPLADLHADVIDAIGWVNPTLQTTVVAFDRFPNALNNGYPAIERDLRQHLGI